MDSPGSRPAEGHRWRRRRTDWYYIAGRGAHGSQFIRASRTNCQPAESSGMTGKGANQQEQIPCPQCGRHVQRRNMKKHQRSQHDGVRRRRHACPFCLPEVHKTYSTFQDWKNHLHTTHDQCLEDDDPLDREEYAAGFKLDRWERFHHIEGDENDRAYQRIATLRKHYGPYQGGVKGEPPGAPSTIRIPHTKGTTPDREVVPAESEFAGSDQDGSDQEEGEITQTEGEGSGTFTQMRPRDSDSGSDEATPGRESWRSARGQELVVLSTPRPRGRGKRRPERREGAAKRPRVESSSSDRRDGSEESRSGGGRDRPGRCSQRAARPSTPPRRPIPASVSPRRSPRLTKSAVQDLRSLPLTTKGGRRTAHSRSVSGDERGQGPRRSSLSSSDHGRSSRGRRSQSREPTPPQLRDFDVGDLPFLFAVGAQDVLHLPGLEEPSTHDSRSVFRGRRPVGPGGIRCRIQDGSMGAIPPHRGGRERPGLSADSYFAEALWPIPGRSQRGAAGSTIYHPHSSHEGYDTRPRGSAGGIGVCRERPRWFRPRGR